MTENEKSKFIKHTHGGNIAQAKKKYGLERGEILDFSANINPLGLSERVRVAILDSIDSVIDYPDPDCLALKAKLSEYLKVEGENIIIGNGAAEIIYLIAKILGNTRATGGYRVLIPAPTFAEYAGAVASNGGSIDLFPLTADTNFAIDFDKLSYRARGYDAVFLCNPNNPTGNLIKREALLEFSDQVADYGVLVIIDEAFMDFVEEPEEYTLVDTVKGMDNVIILGSLTKFFALPGLRLGYAVGTKENIQRIAAAKDPWSVNNVAQAAGTAALGDKDFIKKSLTVISLQKNLLAKDLSRISGLRVFAPSVNFILIDCRETGIPVRKIVKDLGRVGILIRDCSNYPLLDEYYFRLAVRTEGENKILVKELQNTIAGQKAR